MDLRIKALLEAKEAREFLSLLSVQIKQQKPLPAVLGGLPDNVSELLVAEGVRQMAAVGIVSLVLVENAQTARRIAAFLAGEGLRALPYFSRELILHNITASHDGERQRLALLTSLQSGELDAIVTTAEAALQYTLPQKTLRALTLTLRAGELLPPEALCERLARSGFSPAPTVEGAGQFARRGGIVDFCADPALPIRVEFFGDEIDRIGRFDLVSQRLGEGVESARLFPACEMLPDEEGRERIRKAIKKLQTKLDKPEQQAVLAEELAILESGVSLPFADKYLRAIYPEPECLLDYLADTKHPVFLLNSGNIEAALAASMKLTLQAAAERIADGLLPSDFASHAPEGAYAAFLAGQLPLYCNPFSSGPVGQRLSGLFGFSCRRTVSYADKHELLLSDLADYREKRYRVLLCCQSTAEVQQLQAELREQGFAARLAGDPEALPDTGEIVLTVGGYGNGFELPAARITVLTLSPDERAARTSRRRHARFSGKKSGAGERILSYAELSEGDYVVHAMHGIGKFLGMQTLAVDGVLRDYVSLQYAGEEKLFLRADKLDMISRYIGARQSDGSVRLSKIGGTEWGRAKAKAKGAAKSMAKELIALYANRQRRPGHAFPPDCAMEREFAEAFEYEETEPQREAIEQIKGDMMRPVPMDRLLCGDVGFGKTEVALRAAFKAASDGKQTAILVPTTILALQHYQTILSRMRGYPVNVEMLCRFRKPREQAAILRRLARGEIDILVGTHALLGKNVVFRDLGLLIVDEEQRFGVAQKEKIKRLAGNVDVLTLTATPIPRTLNMAMNGIRDMSLLDEAPEDRMPVQTFVLEHDERIVAEAIRRELSRGGQVLYLYNRTDLIYRTADRLQQLLPDARIAVAHGQMEQQALEEIWQALVLGEIDLLVCTTIIETGVDLPNANTLIIEDADRLGLSQLHQLRGRVGRSTRQAYAYCTYRRGKEVSEVARRRLEAIREFAEFGAGFRIALRDLEIRGAGNLLGAEQHGHIDAVGYEMYLRLLNEAVLEERGETAPPPFEATVDIPADAHIPEGYIPHAPHRMEMYKKLSLIQTEEDRRDVLDEFCDRFGNPPRPVMTLLAVALARATAARCRIGRVEARGSELRFLFDEWNLAAWSEAFASIPGLTMITMPKPIVTIRLKKGEDPLTIALRVLKAYEDGNTEKSEEPS